MDEELVGSTKSLNIEYPFVAELLNNYDVLKAKFVDGTEKTVDKSGWRDDMKFCIISRECFNSLRKRDVTLWQTFRKFQKSVLHVGI